MHSEPMPETAGTFKPATDIERNCRHCKKTTLFKEEVWESSCGGYEDYKYTCSECGHGFWIDGIDS